MSLLRPVSLSFSASISSFSSRSRPSLASPSFTTGWFFTRFARSAQRSVLTVSLAFDSSPLTQAIIVVLLLPPSESFSRRVSLLSR